jgi:hypothetical protein
VESQEGRLIGTIERMNESSESKENTKWKDKETKREQEK